MSARGGPAHLLAFDHPLRNQGIDGGFRQAGRNAAPHPVSRAIVDKRGPIGADVGQKLLTKAVEPAGGKIAQSVLASGFCWNNESPVRHRSTVPHGGLLAPEPATVVRLGRPASRASFAICIAGMVACSVCRCHQRIRLAQRITSNGSESSMRNQKRYPLRTRRFGAPDAKCSRACA